MTFPEGSSIGQFDGTWWVAHTRARQEKAFARDLVRRQIRYFLPLVEKTTVIRGRKFTVPTCLFSSYVFVCSSEDERVDALKGNRLAGGIRVADQAKLARELRAIQKALSSRARLDPWPYLVRGRRCRITAGPFAGIEGIVSRRKGTTHVVLSVESLGRAVALEVDAALVETAD